MRRYADPVEVQCGGQSGGQSGPEPALFLWHNLLWRVQEIQASWVETGLWWRSASGESPERTIYRVEAGTGRSTSCRRGVFELAFDWTTGNWLLERVAD